MELNQLFSAMAAQEGIPSAFAAVRRGGELTCYATGFADTAKQLAPNLDTIYPIGSCSKAFIATAVMQLCEAEKLALDSPVKRYLPDFELCDAALTDQLTLRDMLSHTSGLSRHDLLYEVEPEGLDMRELVRRMRHMPPVAPFRYRMLYQNHMFTLASLLVETVAAQPWHDFVRQNIFEPAGMTRTFCTLGAYAGDENAAKPYARGQDGAVAEVPFQDVFASVAAAGCINSTARDMDRWLRLQLGRGTLDGKRVFSEASADALHRMQNIIRPEEFFPFELPELDFGSYGLGWLVQTQYGRKMIAHGGSIRGFRTLACFMPQDDACFTVLCNLEGTSFHEMIAYQISAGLLGHGDEDWIQKVGAQVMPAMQAKQAADAAFWASIPEGAKPALPAAAYCGSYQDELYGPMKVAEENGGLVMRLGALEMPLVPKGGHAFETKLPKGHYPLRFEVSDGLVISAVWNPETEVGFTRV